MMLQIFIALTARVHLKMNHQRQAAITKNIYNHCVSETFRNMGLIMGIKCLNGNRFVERGSKFDTEAITRILY